jgi:hypothetical protein
MILLRIKKLDFEQRSRNPVFARLGQETCLNQPVSMSRTTHSRTKNRVSGQIRGMGV